MTTPFEKACEILGASKLAQILDVSPQAVSDWRKSKRAIPLERCAQIEKATGVAVIRQFAYYDPPGILTVCYGHTGADVVAKRQYSMDECRALLTADMQQAVTTVERCVPGLPVPVLAAFADAVFNLGPTLVCSRASSTAARMLYAGDLVGACNQLPRWDKARLAGVMVALPGLTKRRAAERSLCLTGVP